MNKTISAIQRQLGVIEGAMAGAPQNVADVIFAAFGMIGEHNVLASPNTKQCAPEWYHPEYANSNYVGEEKPYEYVGED